jgi:hypothetical protein
MYFGTGNRPSAGACATLPPEHAAVDSKRKKMINVRATDRGFLPDSRGMVNSFDRIAGK